MPYMRTKSKFKTHIIYGIFDFKLKKLKSVSTILGDMQLEYDLGFLNEKSIRYGVVKLNVILV